MTKEYYKKMQEYLENASGRTENDITPATKVLSEMLQNGELKGPEIIRKTMNYIAPEMRLYAIYNNESKRVYFKNIDELLKYCRQNKLSTKDLIILDYYRFFCNYHDVIRKSDSESSMFYAVCNNESYNWYSDELNHDTIEWEYTHGQIKGLYSPFREQGVVFEDDIYAKEEEKNEHILKFCRDNNLFNIGKK